MVPNSGSPPRTPENQILLMNPSGYPDGSSSGQGFGPPSPDTPPVANSLSIFDDPTPGDNAASAALPGPFHLPPPGFPAGYQPNNEPPPTPTHAPVVPVVAPPPIPLNFDGAFLGLPWLPVRRQPIVVLGPTFSYAWERWNTHLHAGIGRPGMHPIYAMMHSRYVYCIYRIPSSQLRLGQRFMTSYGQAIHVFDDLSMIAYTFLSRMTPANAPPRPFLAPVAKGNLRNRCIGCNGVHVTGFAEMWPAVTNAEMMMPMGDGSIPPGYVRQGMCLHCGGSRPRMDVTNGLTRCCLSPEESQVWMSLGLLCDAAYGLGPAIQPEGLMSIRSRPWSGRRLPVRVLHG